jgi:hypothetical protein
VAALFLTTEASIAEVPKNDSHSPVIPAGAMDMWRSSSRAQARHDICQSRRYECPLVIEALKNPVRHLFSSGN